MKFLKTVKLTRKHFYAFSYSIIEWQLTENKFAVIFIKLEGINFDLVASPFFSLSLPISLSVSLSLSICLSLSLPKSPPSISLYHKSPLPYAKVARFRERERD